MNNYKHLHSSGPGSKPRPPDYTPPSKRSSKLRLKNYEYRDPDEYALLASAVQEKSSRKNRSSGNYTVSVTVKKNQVEAPITPTTYDFEQKVEELQSVSRIPKAKNNLLLSQLKEKYGNSSKQPSRIVQPRVRVLQQEASFLERQRTSSEGNSSVDSLKGEVVFAKSSIASSTLNTPRSGATAPVNVKESSSSLAAVEAKVTRVKPEEDCTVAQMQKMVSPRPQSSVEHGDASKAAANKKSACRKLGGFIVEVVGICSCLLLMSIAYSYSETLSAYPQEDSPVAYVGESAVPQTLQVVGESIQDLTALVEESEDRVVVGSVLTDSNEDLSAKAPAETLTPVRSEPQSAVLATTIPRPFHAEDSSSSAVNIAGTEKPEPLVAAPVKLQPATENVPSSASNDIKITPPQQENVQHDSVKPAQMAHHDSIQPPRADTATDTSLPKPDTSHQIEMVEPEPSSRSPRPELPRIVQTSVVGSNPRLGVGREHTPKAGQINIINTDHDSLSVVSSRADPTVAEKPNTSSGASTPVELVSSATTFSSNQCEVSSESFIMLANPKPRNTRETETSTGSTLFHFITLIPLFTASWFVTMFFVRRQQVRVDDEDRYFEEEIRQAINEDSIDDDGGSTEETFGETEADAGPEATPHKSPIRSAIGRLRTFSKQFSPSTLAKEAGLFSCVEVTRVPGTPTVRLQSVRRSRRLSKKLPVETAAAYPTEYVIDKEHLVID